MGKISGYYNIREASVVVGLSEAKIRELVEKQRFPQPVKTGNKILWKCEDVIEWVNNKRKVCYIESGRYESKWLNQLIDAGELPEGVVVCDLKQVSNLKNYSHIHFNAGIGGWAYAAKLAGWPKTITLWTIQGKLRETWAEIADLVEELRPIVVVGAQSEKQFGLGNLDYLLDDMENRGYACAATVLPAAGVGSPQKRYTVFACGVAHTHLKRRLHREEKGEFAPTWFLSAMSFWNNSKKWIRFPDGIERPIKPGILPLADRVSSGMGQIRSYGKSMVPQLGAAVLASIRDLIREN